MYMHAIIPYVFFCVLILSLNIAYVRFIVLLLVAMVHSFSLVLNSHCRDTLKLMQSTGHPTVINRVPVSLLKIGVQFAAPLCFTTIITLLYLTPYRQTKGSKNQLKFQENSLLNLHAGAEETTPLSCKGLYRGRGFMLLAPSSALTLLRFESPHRKEFGKSRFAKIQLGGAQELRRMVLKRYLLQYY